MITSTNNGKSGDDDLTPMQRQLLAYFSSMKKSVQLTMIDIAEELAEAFPVSLDQGLVVGGQA